MRDPSAGGGLAIPSEIRVNEMYIGTLVEVESREYTGTPHYNKDGTVKQEMSIVWKFELREHANLHKILQDDGTPYLQWRFTSDATGQGSLARPIMEALAGRAVSDAEVAKLLAADPDHMPTKLYGKSCLVVIGSYTRSNGQEGLGITQTLPLSASDKARLQQVLAQEKASDLPWDAEVGPQMGAAAARPAQQFTAQGQPARQQQPAAVAAQEDDDDVPF
jgi:hypothetical protein